MTAPTDLQGTGWGSALAHLLSVVLLPAAALALGGCSGQAVLICDEVCDCQDCSDREYDDCVNDYEAQIDTADVYGCTDDADAYLECAVDHYDCVNRVWSPTSTCARDAEFLGDCLSRRRDPIHYPDPL